MNSKIINLLKDIVPTYYQGTTQCPDKYCIFSYYDEQDSMFYDDTNLSETYYITINYWYKRPEDMMLYKQIKNILKSNGFTFDGSSDLKEGVYYGKNMDFIYEEML